VLVARLVVQDDAAGARLPVRRGPRSVIVGGRPVVRGIQASRAAGLLRICCRAGRPSAVQGGSRRIDWGARVGRQLSSEVRGMDAAEAVIASKLDALRTELAEKVRDEEAYQKWFEEEAAWEGVRAETPDDILAEHERREQHLRGLDEINALEAQVTLLEALQATLGQQHTEKRSAFLALKQRDERSSTQHVWLTLATAAISLIAGWLLSLVGSPSTVLHLFGH
jgi:hypothetical protein